MSTGLRLAVTGCRPEGYAAVPTLVFSLEIGAPAGTRVDSVLLSTQIRIEPGRRGYEVDDQDRLVELFGAPHRWAETALPFLWTQTTTVVPRFEDRTEVEVPVACSYELETGPARYLHAVRHGDVPLIFLFSGTVFRATPQGLRMEQIPWDTEARFPLPAGAWHEVMDLYHPGSGWLRLPRDTIDALGDFKARAALPTWESAILALLDRADDRRTVPS